MKSYIWMCDIISSSEQDAKVLMSQFKDCVSYINKKYKKHILSPLTITLGDEFQSVLKDLSSSIQLMIAFEEYSIGKSYDFKVRHVLHLGEIETMIQKKNAYEMLGPGLSHARKLLEQSKSSKGRFTIQLDQKNIESIIDNSFVVYEDILDSWHKERDYVIATSFIQHRDYKIVSEELDRTRSIIWKREKSLRMSSYFSICEVLKETAKFEI